MLFSVIFILFSFSLNSINCATISTLTYSTSNAGQITYYQQGSATSSLIIIESVDKYTFANFPSSNSPTLLSANDPSCQTFTCGVYTTTQAPTTTFGIAQQVSESVNCPKKFTSKHCGYAFSFKTYTIKLSQTAAVNLAFQYFIMGSTTLSWTDSATSAAPKYFTCPTIPGDTVCVIMTPKYLTSHIPAPIGSNSIIYTSWQCPPKDLTTVNAPLGGKDGQLSMIYSCGTLSAKQCSA